MQLTTLAWHAAEHVREAGGWAVMFTAAVRRVRSPDIAGDLHESAPHC